MNTNPTVLELNTSAVLHNLQYFKSLIKKNSKILIVVKAFGYGSGANVIANIVKNDVSDSGRGESGQHYPSHRNRRKQRRGHTCRRCA